MARKPVLEGGKKDEIIAAATQLFFTEGFEGTSVRKILGMVNGEIGMFYHYFSSKEELFDVVVDRFFRQYALDFEAMTDTVHSPEELVDAFLPSFTKAMDQFRLVEGSMHWTIRSALHERTLLSLVPVTEKLLKQFGYQGSYPLDIAAARTIASVSAAIHSESFQNMKKTEQKKLLLQLLNDCMS